MEKQELGNSSLSSQGHILQMPRAPGTMLVSSSAGYRSWRQGLGRGSWFCVGKIPWRRERLPNLTFWPGEHHGLYSPWDHKELDTTETFTFTSTALWPGSGLSPVARALWLCWTLSPNCPGPPSHAPALRAWIAHGEGLCPGLTTLWRGLLTGFLLVEHDL